MKTVNILGTKYRIEYRTKEEDKALNDCDGYIDWTINLIVVFKPERSEDDPNRLKDLRRYQKKVLRHEIVHGFLDESGLRESASYATNWAQNEEMVDWLAYQGPKIYKAWEEADAI